MKGEERNQIVEKNDQQMNGKEKKNTDCACNRLHTAAYINRKIKKGIQKQIKREKGTQKVRKKNNRKVKEQEIQKEGERQKERKKIN